MSLADLVAAAWARRAELVADPSLDAFRLFHGWDEGCPGIEIDRYGDVVVIDHKPAQAELLAELVTALDAVRRFPVVVAVPRRGAPFALRGEPPAQVEVREHGLRFAIDPTRPRNPGLYLDARPARQWLRGNAAGRRVLNLFAYTGSLGVAAAAGGARSVTHVDSSRSALAACRDNHRRNQLAIDERDLARMNVYQHLRKGAAGRQRFDLVIVDPPPGPPEPKPKDRSPGQRGVVPLAPLAARMLAPGGLLLVFFHHQERARDELETELMATASMPLEIAWQGESGPDFPERDVRRKLRVTAFVRPAAPG